MHTAPSRLRALPEIESRHPDPDKCIPPTPLPVLGPAATSASPKRKSTWLPPGRWISCSRIARKQHSRSAGPAAPQRRVSRRQSKNHGFAQLCPSNFAPLRQQLPPPRLRFVLPELGKVRVLRRLHIHCDAAIRNIDVDVHVCRGYGLAQNRIVEGHLECVREPR